MRMAYGNYFSVNRQDALKKNWAAILKLVGRFKVIRPGEVVICSGEIQGPNIKLDKARGVVKVPQERHKNMFDEGQVFLVEIIKGGPPGPWLLYKNQIIREVELQ